MTGSATKHSNSSVVSFGTLVCFVSLAMTWYACSAITAQPASMSRSEGNNRDRLYITMSATGVVLIADISGLKVP
jgi:hypothetical protein